MSTTMRTNDYDHCAYVHEKVGIRCGGYRKGHEERYVDHPFTEAAKPLPTQPAPEGDEREIRKQALIATAGFIADDRRWQQLRDGGAVCKSHGLAVLVVHVDDGNPCSDYLHDAPAARKAGVE